MQFCIFGLIFALIFNLLVYSSCKIYICIWRSRMDSHGMRNMTGANICVVKIAIFPVLCLEADVFVRICKGVRPCDVRSDDLEVRGSHSQWLETQEICESLLSVTFWLGANNISLSVLLSFFEDWPLKGLHGINLLILWILVMLVWIA